MKLAFRLAAALAVALTLTAADARAAFTVTLDSTTPSGLNTPFNYSAEISAGDTLTAGDFFRIYDFAGLVGLPTAPAGWTVTTALLNPTPPPDVLLSNGDSATLLNLIFTYNGAPVTGPAVFSPFSAISTINDLVVTKDFVGRVTKSPGASGGTFVDSVGAVRVPGVPEPASMLSVGLGLLVLGSAYGVRARNRCV